MWEAHRERGQAAAGALLLAAAYICVGGAAAAQVSRTAADRASSHTPALRYVANAGVLVRTEGASFLIDAPIRDGIVPYATSAVDERAHLEQATGPYASVDAILITHFHDDHFNADAVAAHLVSNTRAVLLSSPEVVERVRAAAPHLPGARLRAMLPARGQSLTTTIAGVSVRVLGMRHNPSRRYPEQHMGFLVGEEAPVLHVGDADPRPDNFGSLRGLPQADLALLPFWYLSEDSTRAMVHAVIEPRRMAAMHVPPNDVASVTAAFRDAGVPAVVLGVPGTAIR